MSNNEHFSSSTVNICPRCWYYRGFWHQACPPMARGSGLFRCQSIQTVPSCRARETQLTFFVAASVGRDYGASCGPAARHSTRSHVPCSFSGIEPISPVAVAATADHYHAVKLIEQQSYSRCIPRRKTAKVCGPHSQIAQWPKHTCGCNAHICPHLNLLWKDSAEGPATSVNVSGMYCLLFPAITHRSRSQRGDASLLIATVRTLLMQ